MASGSRQKVPGTRQILFANRTNERTNAGPVTDHKLVHSLNVRSLESPPRTPRTNRTNKVYKANERTRQGSLTMATILVLPKVESPIASTIVPTPMPKLGYRGSKQLPLPNHCLFLPPIGIASCILQHVRHCSPLSIYECLFPRVPPCSARLYFASCVHFNVPR